MKLPLRMMAPCRQGVQQGLATYHGRLVLAGLLVGGIYLPLWVYGIALGTVRGSASLLVASAFGLGLYQLWTKRQQLAQLQASKEDRWLGHLMIFAGLGAAPFCLFTEWAQRLVWLLILVGIAISTWGVSFFSRHVAAVILIVVGLFPSPAIVSRMLWDTFTPPEMLERFMAWGGGVGLRLIGQDAEVNQSYITLPTSTVLVDWGCSGYDLACIGAAASLLMALYLNQSFVKTVVLVLVGIALALIANVPRIMLMAMADAYWGPESFKFWHGFWGGQIFLTILFTAHYYVVMGLINRSPSKQKSY